MNASNENSVSRIMYYCLISTGNYYLLKFHLNVTSLGQLRYILNFDGIAQEPKRFMIRKKTLNQNTEVFRT